MKAAHSRLFLTYIVIVALALLGIGIIVVPFTVQSGTIIVIVTLISSFIIFLLLISHLFDKHIKPVRSAISVANELAKGNYQVRSYTTSYGEASKLSKSLNELARNLKEITIQERIQENQLKTVIDNMESGLMLIDERGYVHLVNRKFLSMFGKVPEDSTGYLYYDILEEQSIHKVVQEAFLYEERRKDSIAISAKPGKKFIEAVGVPIYNEANKLKGTVVVFHDITELKQLEQMRKDFVANVSHELKTPVTSIRGFAETLLEDAMDDRELQERFLTIIFDESKRVQTLVHDLLELSRLESGEPRQQMKEIDLGGLFEEIEPIVEQQAEEKQIRLFSSVDHKKLVMVGDAGRMKQVFLNLISNAINYTSSKGEVRFTMNGTDDAIEVKVSDNGLGIPIEAQSRIFERFYRVDKARSKDTGGTGLGLAIVKHIVETHRGKIHLDSEPGQGTTFQLIFPK